ncbi:MAG: enoyl-ACP reductase [Dehalococcoidia bacterium]|nr:enoyl-ACP reductase [Dehalococcoidia bacterium]
MYPVDLQEKSGVVFGVANHSSIAWAIAKLLHDAGANLAITYQNERLHERVSKLVEGQDRMALLECDVSSDQQIADVLSQAQQQLGNISFVIHSIAYANREDLDGDFSKTSRQGFQTALEVSAYSLLPIARYAAPMMDQGGSIVTLTFEASERVYPGYNIMGTAKAALENEVRQLAYELGEKNIRVNAISAGPLETLAARGIHGFLDMRRIHAERSPLRRNITLEEVAKVALFLCSDLSSGITGTTIPVDAGYHIMGV